MRLTRLVQRSTWCLVLALVAALAVPATAAAAPPANDSRAGATVIPTLPFSATIDLAEATHAQTDPIPLGLVVGSGIVAFALAMRRRPVRHS